MGGIIIPEECRGYSRIGRVLFITLYPNPSAKVPAWNGGKQGFARAGSLNEGMAELRNKMVAATDGVEFKHGRTDYFLAKFEHIIAQVPEQVELSETDEDVRRCRHCRTAGEGNVMLHVDGYCPNCGRDKNGKIQEKCKSRLVR